METFDLNTNPAYHAGWVDYMDGNMICPYPETWIESCLAWQLGFNAAKASLRDLLEANDPCILDKLEDDASF